MRRFLLLGVALAASGALFVGAVGANNAGSVSVTAGNTSPLSVQGLVNAQIANQPGVITANNLAQNVGDIQVYQPTAGGLNAYQLRTTGVSTTQGTNNGTVPGTCGAWAPKYDTTFGQIPLTTSWQSTGSLTLQMQANADPSCVVSGAVVTITYEAY